MRNAVFVLVAIATLVGHYGVREYDRVATNLVLSEASADILRDQLANMLYELRSSRSYEEGVRDGVENAQNQSYMDGYHTAISQNAQQTLTSESK